MLLKRVFLAIIALTLIAGGLYAESAAKVRWQGQALDTASTPLPEGALLNPHPQYWRDVRFTGVTLLQQPRTI